MDALERMGAAWYITGSEALAAHGSPRQTMDVDVVLDATVDALEALAGTLRSSFYYSEPLRFRNRLMAALVEQRGAGKVDLIIRDPDPWGECAMARRERWQHPGLGVVWVSSLEDLVLAKLEWSEGSSELQLRDCRSLLRMNTRAVDLAYLDEWAAKLGVVALLRQVKENDDAS
jgi:hypothetical protein